ncbi:hypothetical protein F5X99DRAFT_432519 [Biscogniauxia marginata]|nr:hypothetical protein F5X99DRAFT_432519 [Biscogniauxia marginata]
MAGFLVPPWYKEQAVSYETMNIASLIWGFSLAFALFTAGKAANQTQHIWRRSGRLTAYIYMIWGHWLANVLLAVINWMYLWNVFQSSFWLWFFILVIWVFQTQLIIQIIINRVSLLIMVPHKATRLKWTVFAILAVINVAVFCIWIPAQLQISPVWVHINMIWDRIEKCIFLIMDAYLNLYFIYLVRSELIANGLTKYTRLFRFNLAMISVSISMDGILIGLMSMPNSLLFLQFQSVAYLLKLYIEMKMADLIKKIVKGSKKDGTALTFENPYKHRKWTSQRTYPGTHDKNNRNFLETISRGANKPYGSRHTVHIELGSNENVGAGDVRGGFDDSLAGNIQRTTVLTQVVQKHERNSIV